MSLPAQEISVAYAGVTVGGSSTDYTIDKAYGFKEDYPTGEFSGRNIRDGKKLAEPRVGMTPILHI